MSKQRYLTPSAACYVDGFIWAVRCKDNLLMKIDLEKSRIIECVRIPYIDFDNRKSWNDRLFVNGNKLFFFPDYSSGIIAIDIIDKGKTEFVKYPNGARYTMNPVLLKNDRFYIFPYESRDLLIYDAIHSSWEIIALFDEEVKLARHYSENNNEVLFTIVGSNKVCVVNLDTFTKEFFLIGKNNEKLEVAILEDQKIYAIDCHDLRVLQYDINSKSIAKTIKMQDDYRFFPNWAFGLVAKHDNNIFLFPQNGNMILKIDTYSNSVKRLFTELHFEDGFDELGNVISEVFDANACSEDTIYAFSTFENMWRAFDLREEKTNIIDIAKDLTLDIDNEIEDVFPEQLLKNPMHEGVYFTLDRYIKKITGCS